MWHSFCVQALQKLNTDAHALDYATTIIKANLVLPLLHLIQTCTGHPVEESALLLLNKIHQLALFRLEQHGWKARKKTGFSGALEFQNEFEISDHPSAPGQTWELDVAQELGILIHPGSINDKMTWVITVVYSNCQFDPVKRLDEISTLQVSSHEISYNLDETNNNDHAVLDVVQMDDDENFVFVREYIRGVWFGSNRSVGVVSEMVLPHSRSIESWCELTLVGMALLKLKQQDASTKTLFINSNGGMILSFLRQYYPELQFEVFDDSELAGDLSTRYFGMNLGPSLDPNSFHIKDLPCLDRFDLIIAQEPLGNVATLLQTYSKALIIRTIKGRRSGIFQGSDLWMNTSFNKPLLVSELELRHSFEKGPSPCVVALGFDASLLKPQVWHSSMIGDALYFNPVTMDVISAQKTKAVRQEGFLSMTQVQQLRELFGAPETKDGLGKETRSHGDSSWKVWFLHTDSWLSRKLPWLMSKVSKSVLDINAQNWQLESADINLRVAEFHEQQGPSSGLPDPKHYDMDSLITIDINLSDEFEGGSFQTLESDGLMKQYSFNPGDALLFVSSKYHCVAPVTAGIRNVLVMEYWSGPSRGCPHRCESLAKRCVLDQNSRKFENPDDETLADRFNARLPFRLGTAEFCQDEVKLLWQQNDNRAQVKFAKENDPAFDVFSDGDSY